MIRSHRQVGRGGGTPTYGIPPRLVGWSAMADGNTTTATPTISGTLTGGLAGSLATDDIVLAHCNLAAAGDGTVVNAPSGEGWTRIADAEETTGNNAVTSLFWKRWGAAGQTDDTTPTFTSGAGGSLGVTCSVWRGCKNSGNPYVGSEFATGHGTGGTTLTGPSVSVSAGQARTQVTVISLGITGNVSAINGTDQNGMYLGASYATTSGPDRAMAAGYNPSVPNGTSGTAGATTTATIGAWSAVTVILTA